MSLDGRPAGRTQVGYSTVIFSKTIIARTTKLGMMVVHDMAYLIFISSVTLTFIQGQSHRVKIKGKKKSYFATFSEIIKLMSSNLELWYLVARRSKVCWRCALQQRSRSQGQGQGQRPNKETLSFLLETIKATFTKLGT